MTSKKCQSKATASEANGGLTASTTPPLPQAPVPPSELAITTASGGSVVSQQQQSLQPPLLTLRPMRPDSTASSASASSLGTAASAATHSSQSLTITPLMSPQVSLPTEPEPPNSLAFLGGHTGTSGLSGLPMTASKDNPHFLAAMAASAMALSNPLLLNPLLFSTSMMQNSVAAAAASAASNSHGGLDSASDLIKSMKSFLPQLPMPMMSLWSMMGTAGATVPQFKKPTIADTFAGLPGFADEEVANIRNLLEKVNASVTKSLLEDNLKKWASTCGLSTDEILQQLAQAQPLSPAQLLHPKNHQDMDEDFMSDDEALPSMKKASSSLASNSSRPRALISDDQVATLKAYYSINAKPRREELLKLCEEIGHPFKVVKVWFQNTRARDRRELAGNGNVPTGNTNNSEGQNSKQPTLSFPTSAFNNAKHLLPPTPPASCSTGSQKHPSPVPSPVAIGMIKDEIMDEEEKVPLDLSTKSSTPSASPPPLVINSEVITI